MIIYLVLWTNIKQIEAPDIRWDAGGAHRIAEYPDAAGLGKLVLLVEQVI